MSDKCRAEQISAKPRAYVYHNFATSEECDHIVALAKPQVQVCLLFAEPCTSTLLAMAYIDTDVTGLQF